MEILDRDFSLHELAQSCIGDKWIQYLDIAQLEEYAHVIKFQVNRRNELRYTPLHTAIFSRNIVAIKALSKLGADMDLKCFGTPILHLVLGISALPEGSDFGEDAFDYLLPQVDTLLKDDQGSTVMHIAADLNLPVAVALLMKQESSSDIFNLRDRAGSSPIHRAAAADSAEALCALVTAGSEIDKVTSTGSTALHLAAASGALNAWRELVRLGADTTILDKRSRSAKEVAELHGWTVSAAYALESKEHDDRMASESSRAVTAVLTHPMCVRHFTCPPSSTNSPSAPPENIRRLSVLLDQNTGCLRSKEISDDIAWVEKAKAAALSDVLKVHEWAYVKQIQSKCETIGSDPEEQGGIGYLDGDTTLSQGSFSAAMHAAGSVCEAVDMVMKKKVVNAFCAVRPPGHHAGPRGVVKGDDGGPDSHGFCFLNNISIGAAYALNVHRDHVKRVAIVDFDVHHGNGTEETIRWLSPGLETSEIVTPMGFGTLSAPRYKPWYGENDAENVLFVSVHGYGPREEGMDHLMPACAFYPGSGRTVIPTVLPPKDHTEEASSSSHIKDDNIADEVVASSASVVLKKKDKQKMVMEHEVVAVAARVDEDSGSDEDSAGEDKNKAQNGVENEEDDGLDSEDDEDYEDEGGEDEDEEGGDGDDDEEGEGGGGGRVGGDGNDDDKDDDSDSDVDASEGAVYRGKGKVAALHALFRPKGSIKNGKHTPAQPPLILDIGVHLPSARADSDLPPVTSAGEYRHRWRNSFRDEIFPRLMTFKPDVIFISAGFDAHKKDTINSGYIALVEEDFEWVTSNLLKIANCSCEGRVVSALEGGYQIGGEFSSAFAKSVKIHVAALIKGGKTVHAPYLQTDSDRDKEIERELLDEAERSRAERVEVLRLHKINQMAQWKKERELELKEENGGSKEQGEGDSSSGDEGEEEGEGEGGVVEVEVVGSSTSTSKTVDEAETKTASECVVAKKQEAEEVPINGKDDPANSGRKRRRATVDYVALNLELQKAKHTAA